MNQVNPYPLWLGHAGDGRDNAQLFREGIRAVVQLAAEESVAHPPRELLYSHFPLLDGGGNRAETILLAVSTVGTLIKMRVPTLVCCGAGQSRSPAIAAVALAMVTQEPADACLRRVLEHHPGDVSPGLWNEIMQLFPQVRRNLIDC